MPYIGSSPSNGVRRVHTYTATASQTTFTGASSEGVTLSYADTNYIDVFQNGVLLGSADYTATSGTSVVLSQSCSADDLLVVIVYDIFSVADTVSKTNGGSFDSAVTISTSSSGATPSVHSDDLFVEGSGNSGITVGSATNGFGNLRFADSGGSDQGIVQYDHTNDAMKFFSNASESMRINSSGQLGVGTNSPNTKIHAIGSTTNGSGIVDTLRLANTGTSGNDGARIQFTAGSSTSGAGIGSGGQALNSADLRFYSGGNTERCRIDHLGNLLVSTTSANGTGVTLYSGGANGFFVNTTSTCGYLVGPSGSGTFLSLYAGGSAVGGITTNGSTTSFLTSSDYRLKENVTYDFDATTRLKQLKPCRFNFIADPNTTVDGFIAHEVTAVPEAISGKKDAMTEEVLYVDGDEIPDGKKVGDVKKASTIDPQGIDQSKIVPLLVKTIQELEARITALENK